MPVPFRAAAVALVLGLSVGLAGAETLAEAKKLQDAALAELKAKGLEGAAKEFNAGGKWRNGTLYVVVANFKGDMLAHSANDKMAGKNMFEAKDAGGKPFVQEAIKLAKEKGGGSFDVRWANPVSKQIADATFVVQRVPGAEAYLGTMVFK